jgi:hypothetical protein
LSEHLERKRLQKARMPNFGQFTTLNPVKEIVYERRKFYLHSKTYFIAHHALFDCDCLCCIVPDAGSNHGTGSKIEA